VPAGRTRRVSSGPRRHRHEVSLPKGRPSGRGRFAVPDAAQPLGELEGAFGLGPVGQEAAGLPATPGRCPASSRLLDPRRPLSSPSLARSPISTAECRRKGSTPSAAAIFLTAGPGDACGAPQRRHDGRRSRFGSTSARAGRLFSRLPASTRRCCRVCRKEGRVGACLLTLVRRGRGGATVSRAYHASAEAPQSLRGLGVHRPPCRRDRAGALQRSSVPPAAVDPSLRLMSISRATMLSGPAAGSAGIGRAGPHSPWPPPARPAPPRRPL
jgi:hypothetical protein